MSQLSARSEITNQTNDQKQISRPLYKVTHHQLKNVCTKLINDKLVVSQLIFSYIQYIGLIIVSEKVHQNIFSNYHAEHTIGHIKE